MDILLLVAVRDKRTALCHTVAYNIWEVHSLEQVLYLTVKGCTTDDETHCEVVTECSKE